MKRVIIFFGVFALLTGFTFFAFSSELPILAVVAFENHSRVRVPDVENMGLQFLESALLDLGRSPLSTDCPSIVLSLRLVLAVLQAL